MGAIKTEIHCRRYFIQVDRMKDSTKDEILFNILNNFDNINEKQIFNSLKPTAEGYILQAYGKTLKFNKDGDLIG